MELGNIWFFVANNGNSQVNCCNSKQPETMNSFAEMPIISVSGLLEAASLTAVW